VAVGGPVVVLLGEHGPTRRMMADLFGKIRMTSVRRLISLFSRSSGLFDQISADPGDLRLGDPRVDPEGWTRSSTERVETLRRRPA
jgi:hypothetical protein